MFRPLNKSKIHFAFVSMVVGVTIVIDLLALFGVHSPNWPIFNWIYFIWKFVVFSSPHTRFDRVIFHWTVIIHCAVCLFFAQSFISYRTEIHNFKATHMCINFQLNDFNSAAKKRGIISVNDEAVVHQFIHFIDALRWADCLPSTINAHNIRTDTWRSFILCLRPF